MTPEVVADGIALFVARMMIYAAIGVALALGGVALMLIVGFVGFLADLGKEPDKDG